MATKKWIGGAKAVAQVTTLTPGGTIESGDIFTVYRAGKFIRFAATATTVANVVTGLVAAHAASTDSEFTELTFTDSTTHVTVTGPSTGKPFTLVLETTESNGSAADAQTFGQSTTTSPTSPHHWDNAKNWDTGAVPVNSDDVYFSNSAVSCLYGLDQNGVTLTSLTIDQSFTGQLGLKDHNGVWPEDLEKYLKISATTIRIGQGPGTGSPLLRLNVGSVQTTMHVYGTGTSQEQGVEALLWIGTHASNVVNVHKGSVGIAVKPGESATIATLRVGYDVNIAGDARVRCGTGTSLTTINQSGGVLEISSNSTTITKTDGELTINGAATVTTLNVDGGTCFYRSTGTCTTANVGDDGVLDFSKDMQARTLTNTTLEAGSSLLDPHRTVTFTNPMTLSRCRIADVTLDLGTHITLARAAGA